MKYLLIILAFLVLCCTVQPVAEVPSDAGTGQHTYIQFHGDTSFTKEERKEIELAMDTWAGVTSGLVGFTVAWDVDWQSTASIVEHENDSLISRVDPSNPYFQDGAIGRVAEIGGRPAHVWIVADRCNQLGVFRQVVIHELGHILGMLHTKDPDSIMYPSTSQKQTCLNKADMEEYCRVNRCGATKVYHCDN